MFDGPLRGRTYLEGVGFIKTQHVQYLPDREQQVLTILRAGQRTPVFLIGGPRFTRWSWYLRLPGPLAHSIWANLSVARGYDLPEFAGGAAAP